MNSLEANIRDNSTKGELNTIRNSGNVPAIIYGGKGGAEDKIKKMQDCGITIANSPSKIGKTLFNKLSD